jgi:NitT/TauT family transport system substrate-binding protein
VIKLLEKAGLQEGSFRTLILPASKVLESLEKKEIDAGHTWTPTSLEAIEKGYKVLGKASDIPGLIADILVFRRDTTQNRPADIEKVIKAMLLARRFTQKHPEEAINLMAQAEGISKEEMASGIKGVLHLNLDENLAAMKSDGTLFKSGQEIINFYIAKGQLMQGIDLKAVINPQFMQTIKDSPPSDESL